VGEQNAPCRCEDRAGGERERERESERERWREAFKHKQLLRETGGACSLPEVEGAFDLLPGQKKITTLDLPK